MDIYIVFGKNGDVKRVYTRQELADWFVAKHSQTSMLTIEADKDAEKFDEKLEFYSVLIDAGGDLVSVEQSDADEKNDFGYKEENGKLLFWGNVWAQNKTKAIKKVDDYRIETLTQWLNASSGNSGDFGNA